MVQNALTIYQRISDPLAAISSLGRDIAMSKIFGELTIQQGNVFAMECLSRGIPPLMLAEEYDVIYGKLSRKASACLSNFHKSGGTSRIVARKPDHVEIELTKASGDKQSFSLTWEAAQLEPFPYEGKEKEIIKSLTAWNGGKGKGKQPELKPKYATPHSRMQMLWSRLIKDSTKAMTGDGMDSSGDALSDDDDGLVETQPGGDGGVLEAEYEVKQSLTATVAQPTTSPTTGQTNGAVGSTQASAVPGECSREQVNEITHLFDALHLTGDQRTGVLAKRKVSVVRSLSPEQAAELIAALTKKLEQVKLANEQAVQAEFAGESQADPNAATAEMEIEPCHTSQIVQIQGLIREIAQVEIGFDEKWVKLYKATGRKQIKDMTFAEARECIKSLETRTFEQWATETLKMKAASEPTATISPTTGQTVEAANPAANPAANEVASEAANEVASEAVSKSTSEGDTAAKN